MFFIASIQDEGHKWPMHGCAKECSIVCPREPAQSWIASVACVSLQVSVEDTLTPPQSGLQMTGRC